MHSIFQALRPGGQIVLVEFSRIPGVSSDWVMNHVRADQKTFTDDFRPVWIFKLSGVLVFFAKDGFVEAITFKTPDTAGPATPKTAGGAGQ